MNDFARYVHKKMVLLDNELPALPPFAKEELECAVASGEVIRAPVSIYRPTEGLMYWAHDQLTELGLALVAGRTAAYQTNNGKQTIVGTVNGVADNDKLLDARTAQMALTYGRQMGLWEELEMGGVSVFILPDNQDGKPT
ncbi:MAG: hypothetical protein HY516_00035 [Candidatus Aenigmarchaeota archaeon]|nr:hypothetical protein [Candidatus Aenigmarchaeota archaeon]